MPDTAANEATDQSDPPEREDQFDDVVKRFERDVLLGDGPPDFTHLIELIDKLEKSCRKGGLLEHAIQQSIIENRYTRVASAITRAATHPEARVTHDQLEAICRRKQTIAYIFNASGYRNTKHFIPMAGAAEGNQYRITLQRAAVLLCFMALEDIADELMETVLNQPPRVLLTLMLGWLNQRAILTAQAERNRTRLLLAGELIKDVDITDRDIPLIVNAYMYCSYASDERKHELKGYFNGLLKKRMDRAGVIPKPVQRKMVARPKMLLCHERFTHLHAMYRCYAPYISTLAKYFELIAIADENMIDEKSSALFSKTIKLESPRPTIKRIVEIVQELEPDVIYYPSLGMSHWTVMLSNLRLAPIQMATMGHPATSRSPEIDYVHCMHLEGEPERIFSERVLMGPKTVLFETHSELPDILPDLVPPSDREVRVAINSKVMKLSYRLIDICKRLSSASKVPVTFSFFPGERHLFFDGLTAAIKAEIPNSTVLPYMGYEKFVREISKCDLALAAFPFGNTNSTVDTCLLGLPTVANFGPEVPAQTDKVVLHTAGFESWLVCNTDQEYFDTALKLINEPELRRQVAGGQSRAEVRARLFRADEAKSNDPFAKAFWHVYTNHENILASGAKVIDSELLIENSN